MYCSPIPSKIRHATEGSPLKIQQIVQQVLLGGGQLLLTGCVTIALGFAADSLGLNGNPAAPAGPQILNACMVAALGYLSGWLVIRLFPGAANSGRWIWLPPASLLAWLIGRDALIDRYDWHVISHIYFWAYPYQKIAPIGRDILTYPALSAVAYSFGVLMQIVRSRKVHGGRFTP
jgi:hypothetical protein